MKPTIALVILVKNQRTQAEEIIHQVGGSFDEIYILDDDSVDEISKITQAKVYTHKLGSSFSDHRNWILTKVKEDWTFFLDADERISRQLMAELLYAIKNENMLAFAVPRLDVYRETTLHHGEVSAISLVRLAQTKMGQRKWQRSVHEYWSFPPESIGKLTSPLLHHAHKDVTSFMAKLHQYAALEKSERGARGRLQIIFEIFTYPLAKFVHNYVFRRGFLDGFAGLVYALLMSYYTLIKRIFWYEDLLS